MALIGIAVMQVTWRNRLVFKFKNLRKKNKGKSHALSDDNDDSEGDQPPSKKPHIDMDEHNRNLVLLREEMKKRKPKSKVVNNLMDEMELERRRWITSDCPTANEVVAEYPSLRVQKWVSCDH